MVKMRWWGVVLGLLAVSAGSASERSAWRLVSDGVFPLVLAGETALFVDGRPGRRAAWQGAEALGASLAGTELLKLAVRERRPYTRERDSFPSAHAATAFTMAEVIHQYDRRWAPVAFAGATLISVARVQAGEHHWQDVVAGAALGYLSGHFLAYHHVSVSPRGVAVSRNF